MKSISKYFKKLFEEKLIAKEDDGGAAIGGDVGGGDIVSGGDSPSSDIVPNEPPSSTGLTTTDVLGKCDHKKDGVFGPGCFHLPHMIWSVPCYRYPGKRKKKRKLKYSNVLKETDDFELFKKDVQSVIKKEIDTAIDYLERIDTEITLEYNPDYVFKDNRADWIAALDEESKDSVKNFVVAFNIKELYEFLFDQGLEMDDKEIELQIRISLWHDIGHALLNYFRDKEIYDFELSQIKEEELVEEFARYQIRKYSEVYKSKLNDFIQEMFLTDTKPEEETIDQTKEDVLTDLNQPINLSDKNRFISKKDHELLSRKFIVGDIHIPKDSNLFKDQNGKDVFISINNNGLIELRTECEPKDEEEKMFLYLSEDQKDRFIDILKNTKKYIDCPKDDFELQVASEYESLPDDRKLELLSKFGSIKDGYKKIWYRPTLIDVIRICKEGGVNQLPLDVLVNIDNYDNENQKKYIESNINESILDHSFVKDMYRLQNIKQNFAPSRWYLLSKDFQTDTDIGWLYYKVKVSKENEIRTNYIFSSGVLFGYDETDRNLQTVYYIEPCEVVHMLSKGRVIEGDPKNVSIRLLSKCLQNLLEKKDFA